MPLFRREASAPGPNPPSEREAVLAVLDDELWRARRYGRPLSVVIAVPQLITGERLGELLAKSVLETARNALRRSDAVVMVEGELLIAVLPETDAAEAQSAAYRLTSKLTLPGLATRQVKWQTATTTATGEATAAELLEGAMSTFSEAA